MSRFLIALTVAAAFTFAGADLMAHSVFKKAMGEVYPVMKISCNACHVKGKGKSVRNTFGEMFFKELAPNHVTKSWKDSKKNGRPAQKAYEKSTMIPLFNAALKKIQAQTVPVVEGVDNPDAGKSYHTLIQEEKISGITIDQRKKEKLEKAAQEGH